MSHRALDTAVVLAGGQGTRLRPLTDNLPKPLLPIAGRPMLEHILYGLQRQGIRRVALATGYRSQQIEDYFGDGADLGLELHYFVEDEPLGSGGALKNIQERSELLRDTFLVATADILSDVDVTAALRQHTDTCAEATIICGTVEDQTGFGICEIAQDGRVTGWFEKPQPGVTDSRWANIALWIFQPDLIALLRPGFSRVEDQLFNLMMETGMRLFAYRHEGYWIDVGTAERYDQAQVDAAANRFPLSTKDTQPDLNQP